MVYCLVYGLFYAQQRQHNDDRENGKETAGTITTAATMSTAAVVFIERLHIVGIAGVSFTKISVIFRHDITPFQFILKMPLFS